MPGGGGSPRRPHRTQGETYRMKRYLLVVLTAFALLAAACGGENDAATPAGVGDASSSADDDGQEPAERPSDDAFARSASFTWAAQVLPRSFDPHQQTFSGGSVPALVPVHDRLVYIDPYTGDLLPMLATEWTASDDATS